MTSSPENKPLENRFHYDSEKNRFYVNFENYCIETLRDVQRIEFIVAEHLSHLGKRVDAIINYENFTIKPELMNEYANMVNRLMEHFYAGVTRYTTSSSLREELGKSLQQQRVKPNFYTSNEDAERALSS